MIKQSKKRLLVLVAMLHLLAAYDCPDVLLSSASYDCSTALSQRTYDTTFLQRLSPGVTKMTVSFDVMITSWCTTDPTTNPYFFVMSITPDTERLLGKVAWLATSNLMRAQTEDTLGTHLIIQGGSFPTVLNKWLSVSLSFDLATTRITRGEVHSDSSKFANSYTGTYGSWTIDSTLKFYLCADSATSNLFGCQISNFMVSYTYYNNQNILAMGNSPALIGYFKFDDSQTQYSVQDYSGGMGTAYLGTSNGDTTGAPSWLSSLNAVQFTESTYVTLPTFTIQPLSNFPSSFSLTLNMWIKVDSYPSSGSDYIFRYSDSGFSADKFAVMITSTGAISVTGSDASASSSSTVPISTWTSIDVAFTFAYVNAAYFTVTIGTGSPKVTSITTISAPSFDGSEKVRVGGFQGALTHLKVLSPAGHLYNTPSCSSTCYMDLGNKNPAQCIIDIACSKNEVCLSYQTCPDGTYNSGGTCQDCKTGCKTCTAAGANCGSCIDGYTFANSDCTSICTDGTYYDSGSCLNCKTGCKTCTGAGANCASCNTGFNFANSDCTCADGTYLDGTSCSNCKTGCKTCTAAGANCGSCIDGYTFANSDCTAICSDGTYYDSGSCPNCKTGCKTCTGAGATCGSCNVGFTYANSDCTCADGTYLDGTSCSNCKTGCKTCTGAGATCGSCIDGYIYANSDCTAVSKSKGGLATWIIVIIAVIGGVLIIGLGVFVHVFFKKRREFRYKERERVPIDSAKTNP